MYSTSTFFISKIKFARKQILTLKYNNKLNMYIFEKSLLIYFNDRDCKILKDWNGSGVFILIYDNNYLW